MATNIRLGYHKMVLADHLEYREAGRVSIPINTAVVHKSGKFRNSI